KKERIMENQELLFKNEYEKFYTMAENSQAFKAFCKDAFGEDFSQDGFSNLDQIRMILPYVPKRENVHLLDIGCGNGKMLGYLQSQTNAYIHGFDYSKNAIETAKKLYPYHSDFKEGIIGEIECVEDFFDVITSMDSMYFAKDMTAFVGQIKTWMKGDGVFFVGYQEGEIMPKTENADTTELAKAFVKNQMSYEVKDITKQTYDLLKKKREAAMVHQIQFEEEGHKNWFDMLMFQTEYVTQPYEEFAKKMARYIYIARK
ncbi:MAG: methyltransferase domain-containing protein, partial [Lachnospiraceae bacterium]|nr:methyltransferase domain-containing protein [Lachnospiraceae bacterium]